LAQQNDSIIQRVLQANGKLAQLINTINDAIGGLNSQNTQVEGALQGYITQIGQAINELNGRGQSNRGGKKTRKHNKKYNKKGGYNWFSASTGPKESLAKASSSKLSSKHSSKHSSSQRRKHKSKKNRKFKFL
jgi:uncharacterized phage infection (PIP) family protein YhgE